MALSERELRTLRRTELALRAEDLEFCRQFVTSFEARVQPPSTLPPYTPRRVPLRARVLTWATILAASTLLVSFAVIPPGPQCAAAATAQVQSDGQVQSEGQGQSGQQLAGELSRPGCTPGR